MTWSQSVLRGKSIDRARLYGMPHAGAEYVGDKTDRYRKTTEQCVICGMKAAHTHHEPPRGMGGGGYLEMDGHTLRPALFALCHTCHEKRHAGSLQLTWKWDDPIFEEMWSTGHLLKDYEPHDYQLYEFGLWEAYLDTRKIKEIRL